MAIINEQQAAPEIASIPVNNVALAPNGGTADTAMANFKGSDAAMPALASIANIAATMAPAIPVGSEPTADDRDVNALTLDSGSGSQSPTSPRKPRRTLRKATSTATSTEKAKAKEKDDSADDKKWVKATVLNLKDRVDDIETIHLSLAEAVRIDHEENQTEFRAVYRTLQESQVGNLTTWRGTSSSSPSSTRCKPCRTASATTMMQCERIVRRSMKWLLSWRRVKLVPENRIAHAALRECQS